MKGAMSEKFFAILEAAASSLPPGQKRILEGPRYSEDHQDQISDIALRCGVEIWSEPHPTEYLDTYIYIVFKPEG